MNDKIRSLDIPSLQLIHWPDPRLEEVCTPLEDPTQPEVRALVERMFEIMHASRGVGLAAPQVGATVRLFVASPTGDADDHHLYINPRIVDVQGAQDGEEGCLSFPGIFCKVRRHRFVTLRAQGLDGQSFEQTGEDLLARIFEHESDHLDGRLLVDRMTRVARIANRRALKDLQERHAGV